MIGIPVLPVSLTRLAPVILALAPVLYLLYRLSNPWGPYFVLEDRLANSLIILYLLSPVFWSAFFFFRDRPRACVTWGIVVVPSVLFSFLWAAYAHGASDRGDPEYHHVATVLKQRYAALEYYESVTGSYLCKEERIFPDVKLAHIILHDANGLKFERRSQSEVTCRLSSGELRSFYLTR